MSVIVFMVRPASGKLYRLDLIAKVPDKVVIDEFSAVIAVKSFQWERESGFNIFYLFQNSGFAFTPDSTLLCPLGINGN